MLKTILSIAGKPGLYKLISQGKNMLIVETVDAAKKRVSATACRPTAGSPMGLTACLCS